MQTSGLSENSSGHIRSGMTLLCLLLLFLVLFLTMLQPYLIALAMGAMLAILTKPLYDRLKVKLSPEMSAMVTVTAILLAVIIPVLLVVAAAVKQGITLFNYLSSDSGISLLRASMEAVQQFKPLQLALNNQENIHLKAIEFFESSGAALSKIILLQAATLPEMALNLAIALVTWYYMLFDGEGFVDWLMKKIPLETGLRGRLMHSIQITISSMVTAISAAALAQAAVVMAGFLILGIPAAFLAGAATFIFAWIPIVGSLPVCLAGAAYLYFQGSFVKLVFIGVIAVIAGLIDNVIRPLILQGRSDMHPLLALVAIFGGMQFFGLTGVVFGPLVAAMLLSLLNAWSPDYFKTAGIKEHKQAESGIVS